MPKEYVLDVSKINIKHSIYRVESLHQIILSLLWFIACAQDTFLLFQECK